VELWNVSGPVEYDEKGRTVKEYAPYFVAGVGTDAVEDLDEDKVPFEYGQFVFVPLCWE